MRARSEEVFSSQRGPKVSAPSSVAGETLSDEEIRERELTSMKRELHFFLAEEAGQVVTSVVDALESAVRCINADVSSQEQESAELSKYSLYTKLAKRLLSFESAGRQVKGFLRIAGWSVEEAEIFIRVAKGERRVKAVIPRQSPWRFSQIQDAHNHIELALKILKRIQNQPHGSCHALHRDILDAANAITKAKQLFLTGPVSRFPGTPCTKQSAFQPNLPPDIVLELFIRNAEYTVLVYHVATRTSRPSASAVISPRLVGYSQKLRNDRFLEVLEEIEVRCEAPNISKCTQLLCSAFSQCMSLEAKCVLLEKAE